MLYQSTVAVMRDSSTCSNGEFSTMPAVQVSPFSLFRFGSPRKVTTAGTAVKLSGLVWKLDALLPPYRLICAPHNARSRARSGLVATFDFGNVAPTLVAQGSEPVVSCELVVGSVYN